MDTQACTHARTHEMQNKKPFSSLLRQQTNSFPLLTGVTMEMEKWDRGREGEDGDECDRRWKKKKMAPKIGFFITSNEMAKINGKSVLVGSNDVGSVARSDRNHTSFAICTQWALPESEWLHAYCKITAALNWMKNKKIKWTVETHTKGIRAFRIKLKILNTIFSTFVFSIQLKRFYFIVSEFVYREICSHRFAHLFTVEISACGGHHKLESWNFDECWVLSEWYMKKCIDARCLTLMSQ